MKSLVLKDLYNISHNLKSLAVVLVFLAFVFIPTADVLGYIFATAVICSTMVVTTFNFDEMSNWDGYAMILPVSRRDVVAGKYAALLVFTAFGAVVGLVMGLAGGLLTGKMALDLASIAGVLVNALVALVLGMAVGGLNIPLVLKFGPERGRLLLMVSALIPAGLVFGGYCLLNLLGIPLTEGLVTALLWASPLLVAAWDFAMFTIACRIYEKKEF